MRGKYAVKKSVKKKKMNWGTSAPYLRDNCGVEGGTTVAGKGWEQSYHSQDGKMTGERRGVWEKGTRSCGKDVLLVLMSSVQNHEGGNSRGEKKANQQALPFKEGKYLGGGGIKAAQKNYRNHSKSSRDFYWGGGGGFGGRLGFVFMRFISGGEGVASQNKEIYKIIRPDGKQKGGKG